MGVKFALAEANDSLACLLGGRSTRQSKQKAIKSLKWKEEEGGEGGGAQSVQVQKMRKKAKILQAGKKRGRGSLQTEKGGGGSGT